MKLTFLLISTFSLVLLLGNCKTVSKQDFAGSAENEAFNSLVFNNEKPLTNLDVPTEQVSMKAGEQRAFTFADGSSIDVPADAFTDKNGKEVNGDVKLSYKSIKSPATIIASGLHLLYKQGDSIVPFKTGGMFELTAMDASGGELNLKQGKSVTVNFAAIDGEQYNLYRFNETTKQWEVVGDANTFSKPAVEEEKNEPNETHLLEPVAFDENKDFIINSDVNYKKMKELAPYSKVMWKYKGDKTKSELTQILTKRWQGVELQKSKKGKGNYVIAFMGDGSSEMVEVSPVFSKASYSKAMEAYKKAAAMQAEQSNDKPQTRQVAIIGLGIYNLDVCDKPAIVAVNAKVKFDDPTYNSNANLYKYFVIRNNGQTITRYDLAKSSLMVFSKNSPNKLIGLLPDNKIGVFTSSDFDALKAQSRAEVTFNLKVLPTKIENEKQLDEILAKI